jgi:hypothetical protein
MIFTFSSALLLWLSLYLALNLGETTPKPHEQFLMTHPTVYIQTVPSKKKIQEMNERSSSLKANGEPGASGSCL